MSPKKYLAKPVPEDPVRKLFLFGLAKAQIRSRQMTESQPPGFPDLTIKSVLLYLGANLEVIKKHWILLVLLMFLAVGAAGYAVRLYDTRQIDILTTDNNLLKDHISTLQSIATVTPPSQWRRLSDSARGKILASIKDIQPQPKVLVIYAIAETQSRQYASQFADAFRSIGIRVEPREITSFMNLPDIGLMVGIASFPNPSPEASRFKEALGNAGLDVHYVQWAGGGAEVDAVKVDYDLYVGSKPW